MSPVERKKIEDVAKEAGFKEDEIPNIVDLELRMNTVYYQPQPEINQMLVIDSFVNLKHCFYVLSD